MSNSKLILIPQYFGSLVYNRQSCRYSAFDTETTNLLLSSKTKPVKIVINSLYDEERKKAVLRFFKSYQNIGYFDNDGCFCGSYLGLTPPPDHLAGPLTIHLEVTADCNLACRHCFASESKNLNVLSLQEFDRLFNEFSSLGSYRLGLTGGEPLVREDIFEIIDLADYHGLQPCMTTNGLLITESIAKELGKRNFIWLNVSLDGATAETNDAIRGQGTFKEVLKRIEILKNYVSFSLAFTVMKHNINEMQAFCELAYSLGADAVVFRPLYPVGNALQQQCLMPDFSDYLNALENLNQTYDSYEVELCSFHAWGPGTRHDRHAVVYSNFGCGAGNTSCSISSNGEVSPCSFLGNGYWAGNLRDSSFKEIWDNSAIFRGIRELEGNSQCEDCDEFNICSGGCRARALYAHKSINAPDPWCNTESILHSTTHRI